MLGLFCRRVAVTLMCWTVVSCTTHAQVSGKNDHQYFGRPEHATNERPIYLADSSSPGADLVGEVRAWQGWSSKLARPMRCSSHTHSHTVTPAPASTTMPMLMCSPAGVLSKGRADPVNDARMLVIRWGQWVASAADEDAELLWVTVGINIDP